VLLSSGKTGKIKVPFFFALRGLFFLTHLLLDLIVKRILKYRLLKWKVLTDPKKLVQE